MYTSKNCINNKIIHVNPCFRNVHCQICFYGQPNPFHEHQNQINWGCKEAQPNVYSKKFCLLELLHVFSVKFFIFK